MDHQSCTTTSSCRYSHGGLNDASNNGAFIVQLIEHANSLRFTVVGQRRNFDNVSDFIKFIVFYLKLFNILI